MKRMLYYGVSGTDVIELQEMLNSVPSGLRRLTVDGSFGPKTRGRVVEMQRDNKLVADGIAGPLTWEVLQNLIDHVIDWADRTRATHRKRQAIVQTAKNEAMKKGVHAKTGGGKDSTNGRTFRVGHEKLLKYFRVAAPDPHNAGHTYFSEDSIKYLTTPGKLEPMPHWCGIFALWAVKAAKIGVPVGNWRQGWGIASVSGFRPTKQPMKGDVGYIHKPFQHHVIIEDVYTQNGLVRVKTIEGNSGKDSEFVIRPPITPRSKSAFAAFYTVFA